MPLVLTLKKLRPSHRNYRAGHQIVRLIVARNESAWEWLRASRLGTLRSNVLFVDIPPPFDVDAVDGGRPLAARGRPVLVDTCNSFELLDVSRRWSVICLS